MPSVTPSAPQHALPPADLADDVFRTSTLGFFIHGEEVKTHEILTKDNKQAVSYHKDADGLFSVTLSMPNGGAEHWKQTDLMMDAQTGVKVMAYERRNADGTVYIDPKTGRPQALIQSVGTIETNQDIAANDKIVKGQDASELFGKASDFAEEWYQHARQRAAKEGVPMADVLLGAHSMGAFTVGAITLKLHEHELDPHRTVEIEPVGAGAGLEYLAAHYHGNPTPQQSLDTANLLAANVSSFRAADRTMIMVSTGVVPTAYPVVMPGSIFQLPGGRREIANNMVGDTYEYDGASGPAALMTSHKLSIPAIDVMEFGAAALRRTPERDTSVAAFLHDRPLSSADQREAETLLGAFDWFQVKIDRGKQPGDINTTPTDLHADAASVPADLHRQNVKGRTPRNYADVVTHTQTSRASSPDMAPSLQKDTPQSSRKPAVKATPKKTERSEAFSSLHSPGT